MGEYMKAHVLGIHRVIFIARLFGCIAVMALMGSTASAQTDLSDDFSGSRLNLSKWDPFLVGGAMLSTGSGLQLTLNGIQSYSAVQVFTMYCFSGDFDVQVEFNLGDGWNTPFPVGDTSPQLNGGGIAVYLDEPNYMILFRSRFSNVEGFSFYSGVDLGGFPRSEFTPSTASSGKLRIVSAGDIYHFLLDQGAGWIELATAPAWTAPVRVGLYGGNINAHVSFSSTLHNFAVNSGTTDYQSYQLPDTFLRRTGFAIGGQFVNATIHRYFHNLPDYDPLTQLKGQGMGMARGCMTTISDPDLASTPASQWYTLGWKNSYWSSLQMMTRLYKDAMAAGMRINACFYLSDDAADAGRQKAPEDWQGLSVSDTAERVEQYMYDTTNYLRSQGIQPDLYDIGNEILYGILNFSPGDRIPIDPGVDITRSISYLKSFVWPTEATLLSAAIQGVRRSDPNARIVLHVESSISPGMDVAYAFFQTMQSLGVPFDVAGLSLPYMDYSDLSAMLEQEYFQRWNNLVNRIASLGKQVYIAETDYPADTDPAFNPPMSDFPYTNAGQAAYVNSQLRWTSNNPNIVGWTWFYPEWFPGINPDAPHTLEVSGFFSTEKTLRPAAAELNVNNRVFANKSTDFDGDGISDITVWRLGTGVWYALSSNSPGSYISTPWGVSTDKPVPGDYDGDGKMDVAVWRPSEGVWYILPSNSPGTYTSTQWGASSDIPVQGDYDGDGIDDIAVWRPSEGMWYVLPSNSPGTYTATQWGATSDIPAPGDYDGDGKTDLAVWRPSEGIWFILPSNSPGTYTATQWGANTDIPTPGDYDADGKTDIAVLRPFVWWVLPSASPGSYTKTMWLTASDDIPVGGDYDGDGKSDIAVFSRYYGGWWYIRPSDSPVLYIWTHWGIESDVPISSLTGILNSLP
jgi:arabinogalactan endo-1,4-beta-galactosidase